MFHIPAYPYTLIQYQYTLPGIDQGMGYAKGYVPGYGVKHTLQMRLFIVFCFSLV